ncbi:MAG: thioesterase family protein [Sandaracinus sp.]|nr:thioesterase family protein [Myxococcales bacterium]MCB9611725.1 thioesterase family protein [Sandaracinus sp.]MCB9636548.1 thioesterase family protein [Sandaracinus sp.]
MTALDHALNLTPLSSDDDTLRFGCTFTADWFQGRGAYGGIVAGLFARAFQTRVPTRDARTMTVHFCAPATGEGTIEVVLEREGANLSQLSARLTHLRRGRVVTVAFATAVFGRDVGPEAYGDRVAPTVPDAHELPIFRLTPGWPVFSEHFEFRPCLGHQAFRRAPEGHLGGWIRPVEAQPADLGRVCAILDAWPPAVLPVLADPRPAASIDLTFHFFRSFPIAQPDDASFLYEARSPVMRGGYAEEDATLWDAERRLVARVRQNVAVF